MPTAARQVRRGLRNQIDEFFALVHPRDGHPKILAMIDAYLDESGVHSDAPVCVIAGYFGGRGQLKRLKRRWESALRKSRVPLEEFHAKEFIKRRGLFSGWSDSEYDRLVKGIADALIGSSEKIHPVTMAVVVDDFNSFSEDQRRFFTGARLEFGRFVTTGCPSKPYFMPFLDCIKKIASYAPAGGKAHFFCGLDRPFGKYATALYAEVKGDALAADPHYRDRLGEISFPEAKKTACLQAADLLAYLTYLYLPRMLATNEWERGAEGLHQAILQGYLHAEDHKYFDKDNLQTMLDNIPAEHKLNSGLERRETEVSMEDDMRYANGRDIEDASDREEKCAGCDHLRGQHKRGGTDGGCVGCECSKFQHKFDPA